MSSRFWASSDDLSVDSSFGGDGTRDYSRDEERSHENLERTSQRPNGDVGALARIVTSELSLPIAQQSQHASFFYLALIEARCKRQAGLFINKQRGPVDQLPEEHPDVCALATQLFAETKKELAKVGMLPEEFVGQHIPELPSYLSSFDTAINNIATKTTSDLSGQPIISFVDTQALPLISEMSQLQLPQVYSNALVRQDLRMAHQQGEQSLFSLLYPDRNVPGSHYGNEYRQLSKLGSGGFGSVYLAEYGLDKSKYAIKQIIIPAEKFVGASGRAKLKQVLAEVESLAQLNHHNIVRYYHAWLEERVRTGTKNTRADASESDSDSDSDSSPQPDSIDAVTQGIHSIQLGLEKSLFKEIDRQRANSIADEDSRNYIVFEASSSSQAAPGYKSAFRQPGEADSDDDDSGLENDSTEEIPRNDIPNEVTLYEGVQKDVVLHIKMFPYPLSLDDFIWGSGSHKISGLKHCFHTLPTIRLLLAILDGTEYLHRKGFIHRDLKPPNIFVSILEPKEPATHQYVNILDCKECGTWGQEIHLCLHIGDFGLIHDLKVVAADPEATPDRKKAALEPFPFSTAATQQAGTKFYTPTEVPKENPICTKLDVYSFGVITFEMAYKFGTKMERYNAMLNLRNGVYPKNFEHHTLAEGIKAMLCEDRDKRWSCAQVRQWLNAKLKEECEQ
ncbi:kinase-like domain-containing protein [Rhexocercosporidium sp. MPI-PUGE-AT-0058]|nr:kinase-like domain-containing protein [Rhexocercosporidium sp. MPI-PUGE-AT-0058]